jgi:hypothetical protein
MNYGDERYRIIHGIPATTDNVRETELTHSGFWDTLTEGIKSTCFEDQVELIIPPPLDQGLSLKLYRLIKSIPQVESIDIRTSKNRGIVFSLILHEPTELLRELGEIEDVHIRLKSENRILIYQTEK